jgi:hypothetical protein
MHEIGNLQTRLALGIEADKLPEFRGGLEEVDSLYLSVHSPTTCYHLR